MSCATEFDDMPIIPLPANLLDAIDVRGSGDLRFTISYEGPVKVFTGAIIPYALPLISAQSNPTYEVGQVIDFTWNLNVIPQSNPITSKSITPADVLLDPLPVAVPVTDVTRSTYGFEQKYSVVATDDIGGVATRLLGINFYNKVFTGFNYKDGVTAGQILTSADINALIDSALVLNIKTAYGGLRNYVVPVNALKQYIYWAYPVGTVAITQMELSGLPFPIVFIATVNVVNTQNVALNQNYAIVRSANKFSNGTLQLDMK